MEERMLINPKVALPVDLSKVVEVQLSNKRLESSMTKVCWKSFIFKSSQIRNTKCFSSFIPLLCDKTIRKKNEKLVGAYVSVCRIAPK